MLKEKMMNILKKMCSAIFGIWCAFTSFISPLWLTLVFLNLTGLIYKYDGMMDKDEGIAGIIGAIGLSVWLLTVLFPDILFFKYLKKVNIKYMLLFLCVNILLAVLCAALCSWNLVDFLYT